MTTDIDAMLEAHVQFELARCSGEGLSLGIKEEVMALFAWLDGVKLQDVLSTDEAQDLLRRHVLDVPISADAKALAVSTIKSAHTRAIDDHSTISEIVDRDLYEKTARCVASMSELRSEITKQVTSNEVYAQLISHVIYHGIKNYLLNESVIARKVPGASAMMKLGQSVVHTAAPKLEKSVDAKLTSFVNANIQDNIRESRRYLDSVLDDKLLTAVASEAWDQNSNTKISDIAKLINTRSLDTLTKTIIDSIDHLRTTEAFRDMVDAALKEFMAKQGKRTVGQVLESAGISAAATADLLADVAQPLAAKALSDGYIEERIRARLAAFYSDYRTIDLTAGGAGRNRHTESRPA